MATTEKINAVAELTEHFNSSAAAVITEYRGLTVKQVTDLRRVLGNGTTYAVVKNTLTKRAASNAGVVIDDSLLTGPTAIAFVTGDPVEAAKGLREFAKANPLLVIKGGLLDGKALSPAEINQIADLESREVLLSKMAGALKALPSRAAGLFQAPLSQMARLAKALEEKKPAVAPATDDVAAEAPVVAEGAVVTDDAVVAEATDVVAADDLVVVTEPAAVESPSVEVTAEEAIALEGSLEAGNDTSQAPGDDPTAEPAE